MAETRRGLTMTVQISGVRETLKALKDLPPEASEAMRQASAEIASDMVGWIKSTAASQGRQAQVVAATAKANRDRVPSVTVGGSKRVTDTGKAFQLLFGANFGAVTYRTPG